MIPAKIATTAMATITSISVKPDWCFLFIKVSPPLVATELEVLVVREPGNFIPLPPHALIQIDISTNQTRILVKPVEFPNILREIPLPANPGRPARFPILRQRDARRGLH
jgi:hypothetical protein